MKYIDVKYKCWCMPEEATLLVAERRKDEDISDYMSYIQMEIGVAHRKRSPLCMAQTIEYAKLPADNEAGIGFAVGGSA